MTRSRQLDLFSRMCPGCNGTGYRTIQPAVRELQRGGRGWYDLLFQCMARSEPVVTRKTWGWVEEMFGEVIVYGEPFTSVFTERVVHVLDSRFNFNKTPRHSKKVRCDVCNGKRKVTLSRYETYFLGRANESKETAYDLDIGF